MIFINRRILRLGIIKRQSQNRLAGSGYDIFHSLDRCRLKYIIGTQGIVIERSRLRLNLVIRNRAHMHDAIAITQDLDSLSQISQVYDPRDVFAVYRTNQVNTHDLISVFFQISHDRLTSLSLSTRN